MDNEALSSIWILYDCGEDLSRKYGCLVTVSAEPEAHFKLAQAASSCALASLGFAYATPIQVGTREVDDGTMELWAKATRDIKGPVTALVQVRTINDNDEVKILPKTWAYRRDTLESAWQKMGSAKEPVTLNKDAKKEQKRFERLVDIHGKDIKSLEDLTNFIQDLDIDMELLLNQDDNTTVWQTTEDYIIRNAHRLDAMSKEELQQEVDKMKQEILKHEKNPDFPEPVLVCLKQVLEWKEKQLMGKA